MAQQQKIDSLNKQKSRDRKKLSSAEEQLLLERKQLSDKMGAQDNLREIIQNLK
jgi:galactokinase/mevalonate kinase-like predicted kinase